MYVGTEPNDRTTAGEVDGLEQAGARGIRVMVQHDGPTNKADCMNGIYHAIRGYEAAEGIAFQIFVMQDCEDVIHPLCYRLFNYLIPRKDMVQLPVLSLERRWRGFTAGYYPLGVLRLHFKEISLDV